MSTLVAGASSPRFFEQAHNFSIGTANVAAGDLHIHYEAESYEAAMARIKVEIAHWLSPTNYWTYHQDLKKTRTTDTGKWFILGDEYQKWRREAGGAVLWISGMPGAGKSMLCSIAVDDLLPSPSNPRPETVLFVYCRYLDKCTARGILSSMLRQLLESHPSALLPIFMPIYEEHTARETTLLTQEVLDILTQTLPMLDNGGEVEVIIDGLDEVEDDEKTELLDALESLSQLKLLIFSRPLRLFAEMLGKRVKEMAIEATSQDIDLFITSRLKTAPRLKRLLQNDEDLRDEVFSKIKAKASGMFLLASLQFEAVKGSPNAKRLLDALDSMPLGINAMYALSLERIRETQSEEESELAFRALIWVTHAKRPLKMQELQLLLATSYENGAFHAKAVTPPDIILSVCGGLLVTTGDHSHEGSETICPDAEVRLIHFTAQQHLKQAKTHPFSIHPILTTLTLVTFLKHFKFHNLMASFTSTELKDHDPQWQAYAQFLHKLTDLGWYCHWQLGVHARELHQFASDSPSAESQAALDALADFLRECRHMLLEGAFYERVTSYSWAASHGLVHVLPQLEHLRGLSPNLQTALHIAARRGHRLNAGVVAVLLADPEVDVNARDRHGRTVLHQVAGRPSEDDPGEAMLRLILTHPMVDVNILDQDLKTPLLLAAERKRRKAVDVLLEHPGINVTIPPDSRDCALYIHLTTLLANSAHRASKGGDDGDDDGAATDLVNALTPYTADSPLHVALDCTKAEDRAFFTKAFLESPRVYPNIHNTYGETPLAKAVKRGERAVCRLLMDDPKVDVNYADPWGRTPLILACGSSDGVEGDELALEILARHDVDLNAIAKDGDSALSRAAKARRGTLVDALLDHPASNIVIPNSKGLRRAFEYLLLASRIANAKVLYGNAPSPILDALLNAASYYTGDTPLHRVLDQTQLDPAERVAITELLLAQPGVQPNKRNAYGMTPLAKAVVKGDWGVCRVLVVHPEVDVDVGDTLGRTPLTLLSEKGGSRAGDGGEEEEMVRMLRSRSGVD